MSGIGAKDMDGVYRRKLSKGVFVLSGGRIAQLQATADLWQVAGLHIGDFSSMMHA